MFKFVVASAFVAFIGLVFVESCQFQDVACSIPYTKSMQEEIVKYHNDVRSKANPSAKNMQKMYWDETMAKMALAHSKKCEFDHDTSLDRAFAGYLDVGQNLFVGSGKPTGSSPAVGWYNEIVSFTYGKETNETVGHYTQVMRGPSARIGCGGAYCPNLDIKYLVTCNYLKGQANYLTPYELGKSCGACPKSCKNNLCDCGGKVCQHGGHLNLNNCKCNCQVNTAGDQCEKLVCPQNEPWYCTFYKGYCGLKYGFRIRNMCPKTCKLC